MLNHKTLGLLPVKRDFICKPIHGKSLFNSGFTNIIRVISSE